MEATRRADVEPAPRIGTRETIATAKRAMIAALDPERGRPILAFGLLVVFIVASTIGGFLVAAWAGFAALGVTSGIVGVLTGRVDVVEDDEVIE